jgi:Phosphodiester glycosidase
LGDAKMLLAAEHGRFQIAVQRLLKMQHIFRRFIFLLMATILAACWNPLFAQGVDLDWTTAKALASGIQYYRIEQATPRKMVIHGIRADSHAPGFLLHSTPRKQDWMEGKAETTRQTTRNFMRQSREKGLSLVITVNADAFSPWPAPYAEEAATDIQGLAITDGIVVSFGSNSPSLLVDPKGNLRIARSTSAAELPGQVETAVSGFGLCLSEGQIPTSGDDLHPRTGLGLSEDNRYLFLAVIDGRQPESHGATVSELGEWLKRMGAYNGINMDGGGSSTLAFWSPEIAAEDKAVLLNKPVGDGRDLSLMPQGFFKPTERANGNNLGISVR